MQVDQPLDGDGFAETSAADVFLPGEPGEQRDDADPAAHGPEYMVGFLRGRSEAPGRK